MLPQIVEFLILSIANYNLMWKIIELAVLDYETLVLFERIKPNSFRSFTIENKVTRYDQLFQNR